MAEVYSKDEMGRRMDGAVGSLKSELAGLRTGRASAGLLDPVKVEAYGNVVPVNQVGSIATPEPRMITVQVWDRGMVSAVEKAIRDAGLGAIRITGVYSSDDPQSFIRFLQNQPELDVADTGSKIVIARK